MNAEETRHPDWIKVEPGEGVIRQGDRYRKEFADGSVHEGIADDDWTSVDFATYGVTYIWPRPEPQPWEAIPEGIENAAVMAVSIDGREPVVGTYYRFGAVTVRATLPSSMYSAFTCLTERVTSAVPVRVVPTEALTRLRGQKGADGLGATTPQAIAAFLAAVDGADQ